MTEYRNPKPTVDVIILDRNDILLISRKNFPFGFALPGGFVEEGESVEEAAIREVKQETGLDIELKELLYVYSNPRRDPRQHNISITFTGAVRDDSAPLEAGDDAASARWMHLDESITLGKRGLVAFDHHEIISDFIKYQDTGTRPNPMRKLVCRN